MTKDSKAKSNINIGSIASEDSSAIGAHIAQQVNNNLTHSDIAQKNSDNNNSINSAPSDSAPSISDNSQLSKDLNYLTTAYSETKYKNPSNIYPASSPAYLQGMAYLFGVEPQKKIRYLEIGCGVGGNTIPYAVHDSNSEFVGVDLAGPAIEEANRQVKELGLKNVEFHAMSFTDITPEKFGKFDVIVAHGVLSWISKDLQNMMFDTVNKCLTPNGLFYVSYNTLPGWYMANAVADYLKSATRNFKEGPEKEAQVKAHLNFLESHFANKNTPYAMAALNEVRTLKNQPYSYIRHDHMSEQNIPVSFLDVCDLARNNGMQYLSESNPASLMVQGRVPKEVETLNDLILQQWYADVLNGTRFRMSVFVRKETPITRHIDLKRIDHADISFINASLYMQGGDSITNEQLLDSTTAVKLFSLHNNAECATSTDPQTKVCLKAIENLRFKSANFEGMVSKIHAEYGFDANSVRNTLGNILQQLIFTGFITPVYGLEWNYDTKVEKPAISNFVRNQIDRGEFIIVGTKYSTMRLDSLSMIILHHCNGKNTVKDLEEIVLKEFEAGRVTAHSHEATPRPLTMQEVQAQVATWVQQYIANASMSGMFKPNGFKTASRHSEEAPAAGPSGILHELRSEV